jgi:hypothetical protein
MKKLKIISLAYGVSRCRYALIKEFVEDNREETLYIVAELPFYGDDNEMELKANLLFSLTYESYSEAVEAFKIIVEQ